MKKLALTIILTVVFLVTQEILKTGLFFPLHDTTHIARMYFLELNLKNGVIPGIWADTANQMFGYPLLHFYAPLVYYVGVALKQFLPSYLIALEMTMVATVVVGGLGMFALIKKYGHLEAVVSAVAYVLLPYWAINLYVRGALAEMATMALLPWLFMVWRDLKETGKSMVKTALVTTLFVLSHNLIPLITAPFLALWIAVYQKKRLKQVVYTGCVALGVAAFYLMPLIFERSFVQVDAIAKTTDYRLHFVAPWQLWNSTWGFGGSAPGVEDGMSFKVGKVHILLALAGFLAIWQRKKDKRLLFFAASAIVAALFTTSITKPIWDILAPLQIVQFPWRFLTLVGFAVAALSGLAASWVRPHLLRILIAGAMLFALLFFNLKYFKPLQQQSYTDQDFLNDTYIRETLALIVPEYLPAWMPEQPEDSPQSIVEGELSSVTTTVSPLTIEATLEASGEQAVRIQRAYYPTWNATLDGVPLAIQPTTDGRIETIMPDGKHELQLKQSNTSLQKLALATSVVSLVASVILWRTRYI